MPKYYVEALKNVRLSEIEIEADSEEQAKQLYTDMVHLGQIEVDDPMWYALSVGDCDVTKTIGAPKAERQQ